MNLRPDQQTKTNLSTKLLHWYDVNARDLPWRVPPQHSQKADPYRVWLSEIMLQQTTVAAVVPYFNQFVSRWPDVHKLAAAQDSEVMEAWAGLGYYARARNLLAAARVVSTDLSGNFPCDENGLRALPGVGPYTAAAIAAIAYGKPANVVDGNIERVMSRLHAVEKPLPGAKPDLVKLASNYVPSNRAGDYAQALMDLGATICTPKQPNCDLCPLADQCEGQARGIAASLPRKAPKGPKPEKHAQVYVAKLPDDRVLVQRRPSKGLLGGTLGFPHSPFVEDQELEFCPPFKSKWQHSNKRIRHSFTHFHITLHISVCKLTNRDLQNLPEYQHIHKTNRCALPTLFRKVLDAI